MWEQNSIYPRTDTGYAYTTDMNDELVQKFNTGNFTQGSALSKFKYYNPKNRSTSTNERKRKKVKLIASEMVIL